MFLSLRVLSQRAPASELSELILEVPFIEFKKQIMAIRLSLVREIYEGFIPHKGFNRKCSKKRSYTQNS